MGYTQKRIVHIISTTHSIGFRVGDSAEKIIGMLNQVPGNACLLSNSGFYGPEDAFILDFKEEKETP